MIKSQVIGGLIGAFALVSSAAVVSAETFQPSPVLLTAQAEAFPVKSELPVNTSKNDVQAGAVSLAQADTRADRYVAQAPLTEVAPPQPAARPSSVQVKPKTVVHGQKRVDRVAYLEHNVTAVARQHVPVLMLGIGY
jgi:hypothetical protein